MLAFSLLDQMRMQNRRKGSLCSDGQNCIYAELLDLEERKVVDLEAKVEDLKEKAGDLEEKLKRSVEELAAVRQAHVEFVSEVRSVVKAKRFRKKALKVCSSPTLIFQKCSKQFRMLKGHNLIENFRNC